MKHVSRDEIYVGKIICLNCYDYSIDGDKMSLLWLQSLEFIERVPVCEFCHHLIKSDYDSTIKIEDVVGQRDDIK